MCGLPSCVLLSFCFCPKLRGRPTYRVHTLRLEVYGVEASRYDGQHFALGSGVQQNKLAMLADPVLGAREEIKDGEVSHGESARATIETKGGDSNQNVAQMRERVKHRRPHLCQPLKAVKELQLVCVVEFALDAIKLVCSDDEFALHSVRVVDGLVQLRLGLRI